MEQYFTLQTLQTDAKKTVDLQSEHNICCVLTNDRLHLSSQTQQDVNNE
jgi:hypothetical protein